MEELKLQYAEALNLTAQQMQDMTFKDAVNYADVIISSLFQQNPQVINWTQKQLDYLNLTSKYGLTLQVTE